MSNLAPQRIGKGMMTLAWIIGILLLTNVFGYWEKNQHNPNQDPESRLMDKGMRIVELERNRAGHYVSSGEINGQPVTFMLDTGATDVVIPETVATRLQLPRMSTSYASTANGTIRVYNTRLDTLRIGNIVLRNVRASINPAMHGDQEILLGMSVLKRLELRQKDRTLTLIQH